MELSMGWFRIISIDKEGLQAIEGSCSFGDKNVITIGRASDNDIQVNNLEVSKHHAELFRENEHYFIKDTGSKNGTVVNGKKLDAPNRLKDKDWIGLIGKLKIVYYEEEPELKSVIPVHFRGKSKKLTCKV
jgi:pSer/pThr/pTyr-binding forkhead associated (FHA) protein